MNTYNIVTESEESTVIAEYKSQVVRSEAYQSEAELEKEFLRLLQSQVTKTLNCNFKVHGGSFTKAVRRLFCRPS